MESERGGDGGTEDGLLEVSGEGDEVKSVKGKVLMKGITSSPLIRNLADHVEGSADY